MARLRSGPWTIDTSAARACSSPPSRTATGSPTAARSRRTPRWPVSRPRSTPASPPSTPPTSTPSGGPSRCWAGPSRAWPRDSIEIFTKVYWPTGPNPNNRGLSRKHIIESLHASLKRLQTDHVDLLQAHRYDFDPAGRDPARLRRPGPPGQGALRRRLGVDGRADRRRAAPGRRDGLRPHHFEPAPVLADLAGDRGRGRPALREGGRGPDRLVAAGPGRPHREVPAGRRRAVPRGPGPPGSRARR